MKQGSSILALAIAVLLCAGVVGAGASGTDAAKKRCHFVKKKVHGKIKRVRVCTKPKPKPKPKNVSVSLDQGRQASASIGASGGSITAAATGGVSLKLSIPADALAAETKVTLTPVASVRGLPKGLTLLAGVQFAPEGLALDKRATVTIETSKAAGAHAIAWFGLGQAVSRYPSSRSGNRIEIAIAHFSGVAAVRGSGSAWNGLPDATAALRLRFATDVKPGLAGAAVQDPLTSSTFAAAFAWEREVELLGLGGKFEPEKALIRDALVKAISSAVEKSSTACSEGHDLTQVERLTRLDRIAELWGIQLPGGSGFSRAVKCAQFELEVEFEEATTVETSSATEHLRTHHELHVKAKAPLALTTALEGESGLSVTKWIYSMTLTSNGFSCSAKETAATPLGNLHAKLVIDPVGVAIRGYPEITILLDPGDVELAYQKCFDPSQTVRDTQNYRALWNAFGDPVREGALAIAVLPPLGHYVGGNTWATYGPETKSGSAPGGLTYTMTRSLVLRHTPER
jgi:hypothetical protein